MMSDDFWPPIPPIVRFSPSNVRFFGVISDPPSPLKSDIINKWTLPYLTNIFLVTNFLILFVFENNMYACCKILQKEILKVCRIETRDVK